MSSSRWKSEQHRCQSVDAEGFFPAARELAPEVRVNGVAPGAILWPSSGVPDPEAQARSLASIPLGRLGSPQDIARTIAFLLCDAPYITGQVIAVDGGRSL